MITSRRCLATLACFAGRGIEKESLYALVGSKESENRNRNQIIDMIDFSPIGVLIVSTSLKNV